MEIKNFTRYIEIFSNVTDEMLFRMELVIDVDKLKNIIRSDDDDPMIFGNYLLTKSNLEKLGINVYSEEISVYISTDASYL